MALTSQDVFALAMDPLDRATRGIGRALETRRTEDRDERLLAEERERADRIRAENIAREDRIRAEDRGNVLQDRAVDRAYTLQDRAEGRAYNDQQQQAQFDRAVRMFLIEHGVLDPSQANNQAAVDAAIKELSPERQRSLQERISLLREIAEMGKVVPQPHLGIDEAVPVEAPESMDLGELRETAQRMRMAVAQQVSLERERRDREDLAATQAALAVEAAESRLRLSPKELTEIQKRVATKMGKDPSAMSQKERDLYEHAVNTELEAEQSNRLFQYQQAVQTQQRSRGVPYFDANGRPALPGAAVDPAAGGAGRGAPSTAGDEASTGGDESFLDTLSRPAPAAGAAPPAAAGPPPGPASTFPADPAGSAARMLADPFTNPASSWAFAPFNPVGAGLPPTVIAPLAAPVPASPTERLQNQMQSQRARLGMPPALVGP